MADNLTTQSATPATVPSASVIATDDVTGVHFQKVKLDVGGDGVSVPASGDATYGLDVDVTRVAGNVAVTGSFYPATQAVDITANSVLLATAAKQPALGTAGTASTDVITVQGISGGTPQPVSISSGSIGNTSFVATQTTASGVFSSEKNWLFARRSISIGSILCSCISDSTSINATAWGCIYRKT